MRCKFEATVKDNDGYFTFSIYSSDIFYEAKSLFQELNVNARFQHNTNPKVITIHPPKIFLYPKPRSLNIGVQISKRECKNTIKITMMSLNFPDHSKETVKKLFFDTLGLENSQSTFVDGKCNSLLRRKECSLQFSLASLPCYSKHYQIAEQNYQYALQIFLLLTAVTKNSGSIWHNIPKDVENRINKILHVFLIDFNYLPFFRDRINALQTPQIRQSNFYHSNTKYNNLERRNPRPNFGAPGNFYYSPLITVIPPKNVKHKKCHISPEFRPQPL
jgi:hypothetical protein